jgi:hypothetical protein
MKGVARASDLVFTDLAKDGLIFREICPMKCRMYVITGVSLSDAVYREGRVGA